MDKTEKLIDWEENERTDRNRNGIDDAIGVPRLTFDSISSVGKISGFFATAVIASSGRLANGAAATVL